MWIVKCNLQWRRVSLTVAVCRPGQWTGEILRPDEWSVTGQGINFLSGHSQYPCLISIQFVRLKFWCIACGGAIRREHLNGCFPWVMLDLVGLWRSVTVFLGFLLLPFASVKGLIPPKFLPRNLEILDYCWTTDWYCLMPRRKLII